MRKCIKSNALGKFLTASRGSPLVSYIVLTTRLVHHLLNISTVSRQRQLNCAVWSIDIKWMEKRKIPLTSKNISRNEEHHNKSSKQRVHFQLNAYPREWAFFFLFPSITLPFKYKERKSCISLWYQCVKCNQSIRLIECKTDQPNTNVKDSTQFPIMLFMRNLIKLFGIYCRKSTHWKRKSTNETINWQRGSIYKCFWWSSLRHSNHLFVAAFSRSLHLSLSLSLVINCFCIVSEHIEYRHIDTTHPVRS